MKSVLKNFYSVYFRDFLGSISWKRKKRTVLFYRNFRSFQGGHLKTFNYFQHVETFKAFSPKIFFSKNSIWDNNPWKGKCLPETTWEPEQADILFLAGLDWQAVNVNALDCNKPIVNLIQGIRHAQINDVRYEFLSHKAIRICVSEQISSALRATNVVNGPIYTINNGIDLGSIKSLADGVTKTTDVIITGLKNKNMAERLANKLCLEGLKVKCLLEPVDRKEYLKLLASSEVAVMLPYTKEGFYLPALEAMALKTLLVCPDCVGNRGFCNTETCAFPSYDFDSIYDATIDLLQMHQDQRQLLLETAYNMASSHSISREREQFREIMNNIDLIWAKI